MTDALLYSRADSDDIAEASRDNLMGSAIRAAPTTRTFLASAEAVYRQRQDDPGFDFSATAVGWAKAIETELNTLIFPLLRDRLARASVADRTARVDGAPLDLGGIVPHQSLGTLATLLKHDDAMKRGIMHAFTQAADAKWLLVDRTSVAPGPRSHGFSRMIPPLLTRHEAIRRIRAAEHEIRALGVERLALFGSVLRDEARPDSDVDRAGNQRRGADVV